mgnify:CR=1 FL=1
MRNNPASHRTSLNRPAHGARTARVRACWQRAIATGMCSCPGCARLGASTSGLYSLFPTPPLALVPAEAAGVVDRRARFR